MLTQQAVRAQLDTIAGEVLRAPGMYYELYARIFSERVKQWIDQSSSFDAALIEEVAENDPDYLPGTAIEDEELFGAAHLAQASRHALLFNPAWDVQY